MSSTYLTPFNESPFQAAFFEVLGDFNKSNCQSAPANDDRQTVLELCECLGTHFNPVCACGLAQQIGRSVFTHLVRKSNGLGDLTQQSFCLLPAKLRLTRGLEQLETLIEELFGIPVEVIENSDAIHLKTNERQNWNELIPHLESGFIQEFILWVSGGKPHPVRMTTGGPGWSIEIGKQPFDL
jgi:hypothetical protein